MPCINCEAFQQQSRSRRRWRSRYLVSSAASSYYTGYTEIVDCREAIKKEQGSQFRLKQFLKNFLVMVVL
jgi:uncharacterized protein (DUF885 family)